MLYMSAIAQLPILVPNGAFENYSLCPDNFGQINRCTGWDRPIGSTSTPDYYNSCATYVVPGSIWESYNVPERPCDTLPDRTMGNNAYAGIVTRDSVDLVWYEYIKLVYQDLYSLASIIL